MINLKIEKYLSYTVITSVIFLLIYNILNYDPLFGYDAEAHHSYIDYIAMYLPNSFNLPTVDSTREFFNPPLPYLFPAFIQVVCRNLASTENLLETCRPIYGIYTQIFQSFLYVCTVYMYLKIIRTIRNKIQLLDLSVLLVFCILTVNYKTFSMIRGEPYIIFLNSILIYRFLLLCKSSFNYKLKDILIFGSLIGGLALSRQWAFLLFPAYFLLVFFIKSSDVRIKYTKFLAFSFIIGFIISSWFYFGLFFEYGSFTAFNKSPSAFSFSNQPLSFYIPYGSEVTYVFTKPIRPYFSNMFLPILYSDLWGDYWGYFSFTSRSLDTGRNQLLIGDYLARVNIVSLFPTFIMVMGFGTGLKMLKKPMNNISYFYTYITLTILITLSGYMWFQIKYPTFPTGDGNKATYLIQLCYLLGILSINYLDNIKKINDKKFIIFIIFLFMTFVHNLPAMMSHF